MKKYVAFLFCFIGLSSLVIVGATQSVHAAPIEYVAYLDGASEAPPNASPGSGFAKIVFDIDANTMHVQVAFSGLVGLTTASHIHAATASPGTGTAGVATQTPTFTGFPSGVTSGTYDHVFDTSLTSTYNQAFINAHGGTALGAEAALAEALATERAYFNIHTSVFPAGEIRGFLKPVPVPPAIFLLGTGLTGLVLIRRKLVK
jgi:hypothetical protein